VRSVIVARISVAAAAASAFYFHLTGRLVVSLQRISRFVAVH